MYEQPEKGMNRKEFDLQCGVVSEEPCVDAGF